MKDQNLAA